MKISFDIDNTLVPYFDEFEVEQNWSILNLISREKLRVGTKRLFNKLEKDGHEIWVYTTSLRPIWKLKVLFAKYGLYPSGFINQKINQSALKRFNSNASKNPKLFNIDLHIDDSEGVGVEGDRLNFNTLIINPNDKNWVDKVQRQVEIYTECSLQCPNCKTQISLTTLFKSSTISWPHKNWILYSCGRCNKKSHVRLEENKIEIGEIDGFPGPVFYAYCECYNPNYKLNIKSDGIFCIYNNESYKFRSK